MSLAEECLAVLASATKTISTRRAAKIVQSDFDFDTIDHMDEGVHIYRFSDGSRLATDSYRRNIQRWVIADSPASV